MLYNRLTLLLCFGNRFLSCSFLRCVEKVFASDTRSLLMVSNVLCVRNCRFCGSAVVWTFFFHWRLRYFLLFVYIHPTLGCAASPLPPSPLLSDPSPPVCKMQVREIVADSTTQVLVGKELLPKCWLCKYKIGHP